MAIGAAQAAVEAGRREGIRFWGADGELDFFKGIKSGLVDGVSAIAANAVPDTVMYLGAWLMTARREGRPIRRKHRAAAIQRDHREH